ncbi:SMP-30/gluconolactonase/LRE family protein [Winogradskyella forsetii]|uniref:SMP-30/gluconolactonase/LRE family protein n=1 Tax=Winogradskyella forsetii TaxID=2686077 RepID=UPI001C4C67DA|nr:SMP-30/gluconolactonase/LRE family protein [Winogradskyella forsetii]
MHKKIGLLLILIGLLTYYAFTKLTSKNMDQNMPKVISDLKTIKTGFEFTEGPAVDKNGNVFFTDQPNDAILKWDAKTNQVSTFLKGTGRSNGMAFDKDGFLIACADMHGELWKIATDGSHEVLVDNYKGKKLNGPNDVWIHPISGGIYITDPLFTRDYWTDDDPRKQSWPPTHSEQADIGKGGHVYYLAPESDTLTRVTNLPGWDSDCWPNGIVGTPDGKILYVNKWTEDNLGGTWVFDIKADGTLTNMKKIIDMGGDGMSMDELGNIYISNGLGVIAFNSEGENVLNINLDGGSTNNVFCSDDEKTLFITKPKEIVSVRLNVKGVEKF